VGSPVTTTVSLRVTVGVGFNATNDKLILDTDITLRGDITATNKVIGTVAGYAAPLLMKQLLRLIHYLQYLYK
jgi:hypothetical protein